MRRYNPIHPARAMREIDSGEYVRYDDAQAEKMQTMRDWQEDAEIARLQKEKAENTVLTCVYCGHQYPDGTPAAKHKLLTDHIRVCDKHPLREAEQKIEQMPLPEPPDAARAEDGEGNDEDEQLGE